MPSEMWKLTELRDYMFLLTIAYPIDNRTIALVILRIVKYLFWKSLLVNNLQMHLNLSK